MPSPSLTVDQVRAVRIAAQGLPPPKAPKVLPQLARSGWQRTLGGADVYVGARARVPGLARAQLDALVTAGELCVVPAVRGCIYLVPGADVPLCLTVARSLARARDDRDAERAGIEGKELDDLGREVVAELERRGPRTTDALRKALPATAVRSLGDKGKKVGIGSTLPPALRRLEFAGRIARTPVDGRLDHEKYLWRATAADPFATAGLPREPAELHARLLRQFVQRAGVTTLPLFCAWSGLAVRDAKQALAVAELETVQAEGLGEALASPDVGSLLEQADTAREATALLPFEDNLLHLAGGLAPLVAARAHGLEVPVWGEGERLARLGDAGHVLFRGILAEGRVRGFWEYDPDAGAVVTHLFDPPGKKARKAIVDAAAALAAFLRDELGHGHSFSLDSDAELRRRLAVLRAMG